MKYETVHNITLPKIGFGTWSIGGGSHPNPRLDSDSLTALRSALETGYTHFDTAEVYAAGHSEEMVGRAVRETNTPREKVFITTKVSPEHLGYEDVLRSCENSLRRLQMDYIDLYLIHWPGKGVKYEETFRALNKLVNDGKIKHIGVSNFKLPLLKQAQELSETPILTNQVPYRLPDKTYVENGVLEYCT
jgi:diketogulonate reductase-like aldo/keto reductase